MTRSKLLALVLELELAEARGELCRPALVEHTLIGLVLRMRSLIKSSSLSGVEQAQLCGVLADIDPGDLIKQATTRIERATENETDRSNPEATTEKPTAGSANGA